jgi:hypothetical protein
VAALNLGNKAHGSDCPSVCGLTDLSACPSIDASICAYVHRFGFVSTYTFVLVCIYIIYIYMCIYTHTYAPIDDLLAHMQLSVVVSIDLPTYLSISLFVHRPINLFTYQIIHLSIYLSIFLHVDSMCLWVHLCCLLASHVFLHLSICPWS